MIIFKFIFKPILLIVSLFCRIFLRIFWKRVDLLPYDVDKGILLMAPHTSKWDGFWGIIYLLAYLFYNRHSVMAFREESNTKFGGPILKFLGAEFIDRHNEKNKGVNTINLFLKKIKQYKRIFVAIFAEGTRAPVENFNPGFYYIAFKAKVPILTLKFDYGSSKIETGPIIMPSGSYKKDLIIWETFFKDAVGKIPQNFQVFKKNSKLV